MSEVGEMVVDAERKPTFVGTYFREQATEKSESLIVRGEGDKVSPLFLDRDFREARVWNLELTEERVRREYIAMKLCEMVGLKVPRVRLISRTAGVGLAVEDLGVVKKVVLPEARLTGAQEEQLKGYYLMGRWLNNSHFAVNLASDMSGKLVLTNALYWGWINESFSKRKYQPGYSFDFGFYDSSPEIRGKFEKKFGVGMNKRDPVVEGVLVRMKAVRSEEIAGLVLESGLAGSKAREVIEELLVAREKMLGEFETVDPGEALVNSPQWEKLDKLLERSGGNTKFATLAAYLGRQSAAIRNIANSLQATEGELGGKGKGRLELRKARSLLENVSERKMGLQERVDLWARVSSQVRVAKIGSHPWWYKLAGYESLEMRVKQVRETLKSELRGLVVQSVHESWLDKKWGMSGLGGRSGEYVDRLENLMSPTREQVVVVHNFAELLISQTLQNIGFDPRQMGREYDAFLASVESLKRRRVFFKEGCELRSRALVSHLSVPEGIKESVEAGMIESSLFQRRHRKRVRVGSPGGERTLRPEVAFMVAGAGLGYGGESVRQEREEKGGLVSSASGPFNPKQGFEFSVGWVGTYGQVVEGRLFAETVNTSGEKYQELHVFDQNYDENRSEGTAIPIDELVLVVPQLKQAEWEDYLILQGRSREWVNRHLRSYPDYLDINLYLRWFVAPEKLDLSGGMGMPVTDLSRSARVLLREEKPSLLFHWVELGEE